MRLRAIAKLGDAKEVRSSVLNFVIATSPDGRLWSPVYHAFRTSSDRVEDVTTRGVWGPPDGPG
jgi:hypothetical protein